MNDAEWLSPTRAESWGCGHVREVAAKDLSWGWLRRHVTVTTNQVLPEDETFVEISVREMVLLVMMGSDAQAQRPALGKSDIWRSRGLRRGVRQGRERACFRQPFEG